MSKQVEVKVFHEMDNEEIIEGFAKLNLETGYISKLEYSNSYSISPHKLKDYSFSYGLIELNGKELEFTVEVQKDDTYKIPTNEFSEVKEKAIILLSSTVKTKKFTA